jgi:alpha-tubulin suppressor-like RCC1 family protein
MIDIAQGPDLQLTLGINHACAMYDRTDSKRGIFCWGANDSYQLGNGQATLLALGSLSTDFVSSNSAFVGGGFSEPVAISSGFEHTCYVQSDNQVWCWGLGQAYNNSTSRTARQLIFDAMQ